MNNNYALIKLIVLTVNYILENNYIQYANYSLLEDGFVAVLSSECIWKKFLQNQMLSRHLWKSGTLLTRELKISLSLFLSHFQTQKPEASMMYSIQHWMSPKLLFKQDLAASSYEVKELTFMNVYINKQGWNETQKLQI
jgi:hypothetical protein